MGMSDFQIEAAAAEKKRLADLIEADKMRYFSGGDYRNEDARLAQPQAQPTISDLFRQQDPSIYDSNRSLSVSYADPNKPEIQSPAPLGQGNWDNRVVDNQTGRVQYLQSVPEVQGVNRSVNQVEVPGYGKGYYLKGDSTRAVLANGQIVDLGRDTTAERTRTKENLALDKTRADIQQTLAKTDKETNPKAPPNFRFTADGNLEPIPGGKEDFKRKQSYAADHAEMQSSLSDLDRLGESASDILKTANLGRVTGIPGALPNVPGMAGADAAAKLETLRSQIGFGVLQSMRNASKTGGALGNVSDAEGKRLEANLASLGTAQSEEQMRQNLERIVDFTTKAKGRVSEGFGLKYGDMQPQTPKAAPQVVSMNDVFIAAKKTGKSIDEVMRDARAKGHQIQGA